MTQYNDISNLTNSIADLRRQIRDLQTQPRLISSSIDRGGTQSSDYDGSGIDNPGTKGWIIGTDEATGRGYVHINGRVGGVFASAATDPAFASLVASVAKPIMAVRTGSGSNDFRFSTDGVVWSRTVPMPAPYIEPVIQGTWSNYLSGFHKASYMKTSQGIVCLSGLVTNSTNSVIFNLPVGYRPDKDLIFPTLAGTSFSMIRITAATGDVSFIGSGATFVTLSGIMFPAAGVATWTPVTNFASGWASYHTIDPTWGVLSYWRDPLGRVWMDGLVRQITPVTLPADTAMFSIPFAKNSYSHYPAAGNSAIANIHVTDVSGQATFFAKTGTNAAWLVPQKCVFPDNNVRSDWNQIDVYYNGWVKYASATFPPRRWMKFDDGIVMQDGLISSGTTGTGPTAVSQLGIETAMTDHQPGWNNNRSGNEIFYIAANLAAGRVGLVGTAPFSQNAGTFAWEENLGSNAWHSYGGVNYVAGA